MDALFEESDCGNAHHLPDVILTLGEEKKTLAISPSVYMVVMPIGLGTGLKEWRSTKAANLTNAVRPHPAQSLPPPTYACSPLPPQAPPWRLPCAAHTRACACGSVSDARWHTPRFAGAGG